MNTYNKDKVEYIHKRIDFFYKRMGVYTFLITVFYFNSLKYILPYSEKIFIYSSNKLSNIFAKLFGIENLYGFGDFLGTFALFPMFFMSYSFLTLFWVYFILKDFQKIHFLNKKLIIFDKHFKLNLVYNEEKIFYKILEKIIYFLENLRNKQLIGFIFIILYIILVIYRY